MALSISQLHPVMCITQDNVALSHVGQAEHLCAAGARWVQLRMKHVERAAWLSTAVAVVEVCRAHHAVCIINDSVDVALAAGADGVHLGRNDGSWREARRHLGPRFILGGTVNNAEDARHAVLAECLDYVGVGPWRFTRTKQNLAPVLGADGIRGLVRQLDGLPAWAIGGIEPADIPEIRTTGVVGVAVSSALCRDGTVAANYTAFLRTWEARPPEERTDAPL